MTARETIMEGNEGMEFRDVIDNLYDGTILECMKSYAKEKCQELLEIVAEKAKVKVSQHCFELSEEVDKDSILNAVNLDEFIK